MIHFIKGFCQFITIKDISVFFGILNRSLQCLFRLQGEDKAAEYQAAMAEQLAKLQEWNANASAKREQREAFQRRQRQYLNSVRG